MLTDYIHDSKVVESICILKNSTSIVSDTLLESSWLILFINTTISYVVTCDIVKHIEKHISS